MLPWRLLGLLSDQSKFLATPSAVMGDLESAAITARSTSHAEIGRVNNAAKIETGRLLAHRANRVETGRVNNASKIETGRLAHSAKPHSDRQSLATPQKIVTGRLLANSASRVETGRSGIDVSDL